MLVGIEGVDSLRDESLFNIIACRVVVAGVVGSDTVKLR